VLFDAVNEELWSYFYQKTNKNQSLSQFLHLQTMDLLLNLWTIEGGLSDTDEATFLQMAKEQAERILKEYESVIADKSSEENYFAQLKLKLKAKLQLKKAHNPRFFAYYVHYFRYYFF